jgi:hypothetical protein
MFTFVYILILNKSNTTVATSRAGVVHPSGAPGCTIDAVVIGPNIQTSTNSIQEKNIQGETTCDKHLQTEEYNKSVQILKR